ncbi:MAG: patatin-like phospholipase family protein [Solirubrobacterales bacterium]
MSGEYAKPDRNCDIVMKGGITSGVVYPRAVCELAKTFRFRNIGGTSAGAIAAAAAAAAEYGRDVGGFEALEKLPKWIGEGSHLRNLFQAQRRTRGLFAVVMAKVARGWWWAIAVGLLRNLPLVVAGALPAVFLVLLADPGSSVVLKVLTAACGILLGVLGVALAVIAFLAFQLLRAVPGNDFGLCSGWTEEFERTGEGTAPLTPWLYRKLNEYAALPLEEPLTFGHLWVGRGGDRTNPPRDPEKRQLSLAMMTTNLTNRRAHQLPFESAEWLFCPDELRRFFPGEVVDWMEGTAGEEVTAPSGERLLELPAAKDMPVIVTTRLSLSFPVLLSALPLWRREQVDGPSAVPAEPRRCWFSDGGIASNFPIHFFDRLVPRWPTFGINLRPFRPGEAEAPKDKEMDNTWMVGSESEEIADWWYENGSLLEFLGGIGHTMQNRVDEAQMRVPGYRDRIAHVSLTDVQGGMNLAMEEDVIKRLIARGGYAAERLRDVYTREPAPDRVSWDAHRWTRLRSALAVLEEMHTHFKAGYEGEVEPAGAPTYAEMLASGEDGSHDYPWADDRQLTLAGEEVEAILAGGVDGDATNTVATGGPQPAPEGRIEPRG